MTNFQEIPLNQITPSPLNPRKNFTGKKLDELAASIKQKGVIEPIIVRPIKGKKTPYEIVAGERRFKAAGAAGLTTIPAIVRELTDDEAYDFMLVENLQRDDLTDREEAESFKAYIARHGEEAIASLAEKTGITPAYIRGRARVLELPARVLKAWEEGKLVFGHLQQLLRVAADPQVLKKITDDLMSSTRWDGGGYTVARLRREINDLAPVLSGAFFPAAKECAGCGSSSTVQKDLFGVDTDKARCLNPGCYKKLQNEYLVGHWKETSLAAAHGTNGFRFEDRRGGCNYHTFRYGPKPAEKCKACPSFITIIHVDGTVDEPQVCFGKQECFSGATRAKPDKAKPRDPEAPRASWHGTYFRDRFLRARLEAILDKETEKPDAGRAAKLCLYALLKSSREGRLAAGAAFGMKPRDSWGLPGKALDLKVIKELPAQEILRSALRAAKAVLLEGQVAMSDRHMNIGVGVCERQLIAEFLGVDLVKEYAVDKDYLEKKTKAEICAFIRKQGVLNDEKARRYWEKKVNVGWTCLESLKKPQLIDFILKSGVDLVGKVPDEILKGAAKP